MSQTLSAKQQQIINEPVDFVKSYFSKIAENDLISALNDTTPGQEESQASSQL